MEQIRTYLHLEDIPGEDNAGTVRFSVLLDVPDEDKKVHITGEITIRTIKEKTIQ
jgi:hypothetical protein